MKLLGRSQRGPIGLDLYGREIKAVQLVKAGQQWTIQAATVVPQGSEALDGARVEWLCDVFARQGFKGNEVVVCAPPSKLESEMLELPPRTSGAPVEQIARTEMARVAKLEDGAFEMASWDLPSPPRGGAGTSMLAVALKHADSEALLDPLMAGGLDVVAIDARAWALARVVSAMDGQKGPRAVLDLDWESGFLVFMHDGKVLFQRNLQEVGIGSLYRGVASQFDLTDEVTDYLLTQKQAEDGQSTQRARIATLISQYAATLTDELESSFAFAGHRYRELAPERLLVCGTGARVAGLCEDLGGRLKVKVERMLVDAAAKCSEGLTDVCGTPALMAALGLAMYEKKSTK